MGQCFGTNHFKSNKGMFGLLKYNYSNSGSSSCTPCSKDNLFASTFASNSNFDDHDFQPPRYPTSTITMSPIKFSTRKVRKVLLQLSTSKSSGPDCIPAIVLKSYAPELAPILNKLFQLSRILR